MEGGIQNETVEILRVPDRVCVAACGAWDARRGGVPEYGHIGADFLPVEETLWRIDTV